MRIVAIRMHVRLHMAHKRHTTIKVITTEECARLPQCRLTAFVSDQQISHYWEQGYCVCCVHFYRWSQSHSHCHIMFSCQRTGSPSCLSHLRTYIMCRTKNCPSGHSMSGAFLSVPRTEAHWGWQGIRQAWPAHCTRAACSPGQIVRQPHKIVNS